jgi:hypothetical protein
MRKEDAMNLRILHEATQYRLLRGVFEQDKQIGPQTAATLRACFETADRDLARLRKIAAGGR